MKRIGLLLIFFIFPCLIFTESRDWDVFFNERLSYSLTASLNDIEFKKIELLEYKEKTKWIPSLSFDFPKLFAWKNIPVELSGANSLIKTKYIDVFNGKYSLVLNQALPSAGNILFSFNFNYEYLLQSKEFKQIPSFTIQLSQPITKYSFGFVNEAKKISFLKKSVKEKRFALYADFIKTFLKSALNIEVLNAESAYLKNKYLYAAEQYSTAEIEFKKERLKLDALLQIKQKMIEAKQEYGLNLNSLNRSKEEFVLNYNYEYSLMNEEDMSSLLEFLENVFLDSYIFDIQNTEYEIFLLNAEKEQAYIKNAPRFNIGFSHTPNTLKTRFSSYTASWQNLKQTEWLPELFISFSWTPDYTFTQKKEIDLIDLKISYAKNKLKTLKEKKEIKNKAKTLRIKNLKEDLHILSENLNLYLELNEEYKKLYKDGVITNLSLLEYTVTPSRQKLLKLKKLKDLIFEIF